MRKTSQNVYFCLPFTASYLSPSERDELDGIHMIALLSFFLSFLPVSLRQAFLRLFLPPSSYPYLSERALKRPFSINVARFTFFL